MFDWDADKAPYLNDFPVFFFQKHWDLLKDSLLILYIDLFKKRVNLEHLNWIHIALIIKNNSHEMISNFRLSIW